MARQLSSEANEKMIAAAQSIISDLGVSAVTVDEVARRSGVAKTTIYRHFDSSAALTVKALDCMVEPFPMVDTGTLKSDLRAFTRAILPNINRPETRRMLADLFAMSARQADFGRVHQTLVNERKAPLRMMFQRAIARGELAADTDLELAIDVFEGVFIYRRVLLDQTITEANVDAVVEMFERAFTA